MEEPRAVGERSNTTAGSPGEHGHLEDERHEGHERQEGHEGQEGSAGPSWYAFKVKTRQEVVAATEVRALDIVDDVFVPTRSERRRRTDRVKVVEVPLFPGYLFGRLCLTAASRQRLLKVPTVFDVVGRRAAASIAPSIPDQVIASLQALQASGRTLDPILAIRPGQLVDIVAGPLRGVRGVVLRGADGQRRLVVHIHLLGRAVQTVLAADDVWVVQPR